MTAGISSRHFLASVQDGCRCFRIQVFGNCSCVMENSCSKYRVTAEDDTDSCTDDTTSGSESSAHEHSRRQRYKGPRVFYANARGSNNNDESEVKTESDTDSGAGNEGTHDRVGHERRGRGSGPLPSRGRSSRRATGKRPFDRNYNPKEIPAQADSKTSSNRENSRGNGSRHHRLPEKGTKHERPGRYASEKVTDNGYHSLGDHTKEKVDSSEFEVERTARSTMEHESGGGNKNDPKDKTKPQSESMRYSKNRRIVNPIVSHPPVDDSPRNKAPVPRNLPPRLQKKLLESRQMMGMKSEVIMNSSLQPHTGEQPPFVEAPAITNCANKDDDRQDARVDFSNRQQPRNFWQERQASFHTNANLATAEEEEVMYQKALSASIQDNEEELCWEEDIRKLRLLSVEDDSPPPQQPVDQTVEGFCTSNQHQTSIGTVANLCAELNRIGRSPHLCASASGTLPILSECNGQGPDGFGDPVHSSFGSLGARGTGFHPGTHFSNVFLTQSQMEMQPVTSNSEHSNPLAATIQKCVNVAHSEMESAVCFTHADAPPKSGFPLNPQAPEYDYRELHYMKNEVSQPMMENCLDAPETDVVASSAAGTSISIQPLRSSVTNDEDFVGGMAHDHEFNVNGDSGHEIFQTETAESSVVTAGEFHVTVNESAMTTAFLPSQINGTELVDESVTHYRSMFDNDGMLTSNAEQQDLNAAVTMDGSMVPTHEESNLEVCPVSENDMFQLKEDVHFPGMRPPFPPFFPGYMAPWPMPVPQMPYYPPYPGWPYYPPVPMMMPMMPMPYWPPARMWPRLPPGMHPGMMMPPGAQLAALPASTDIRQPEQCFEEEAQE